MIGGPSLAVLGVDPGVNGGLALLRADGSISYVQGFRPTMTHTEVVDIVRIGANLLKAYGSSMAFVEKVGYMPGDGGQGANTFGRVDGLLRGALLMAEISVRDVPPQQWQTAMLCLSGGNKNVTKNRALELFPGQKITHAVADALLIAEYGRRRLAL